MAPYVEMEWGTKAYELMWELKELFDPDYVLNPGVILNKARRALFIMLQSTGLWGGQRCSLRVCQWWPCREGNFVKVGVKESSHTCP